jgi:phosphoribosylformylglycinamidine synthase subunit PurL
MGLMNNKKSYFDNKGETLYLVKDGKTLDSIKSVKKDDFVSSIIEIGKKGLFYSLIEACKPGLLGFDITVDSDFTEEEFLYKPTEYIAVISLDDEQEENFIDYIFDLNENIILLGHTTKGEIRIDDKKIGLIEEYL